MQPPLLFSSSVFLQVSYILKYYIKYLYRIFFYIFIISLGTFLRFKVSLFYREKRGSVNRSGTNPKRGKVNICGGEKIL